MKPIEELEKELEVAKALLLETTRWLGSKNDLGARIRGFLEMPKYDCAKCNDSGTYKHGNSGRYEFCSCKAGDCQRQIYIDSR